jgi:hypothetical protein
VAVAPQSKNAQDPIERVLEIRARPDLPLVVALLARISIKPVGPKVQKCGGPYLRGALEQLEPPGAPGTVIIILIEDVNRITGKGIRPRPIALEVAPEGLERAGRHEESCLISILATLRIDRRMPADVQERESAARARLSYSQLHVRPAFDGDGRAPFVRRHTRILLGRSVSVHLGNGSIEADRQLGSMGVPVLDGRDSLLRPTTDRPELSGRDAKPPHVQVTICDAINHVHPDANRDRAGSLRAVHA